VSLLIALMIAQAGTAAAGGGGCKNPITQMDMNSCAAQDYRSADRELNAQWAITTSEMRQADIATRPQEDGRPGYYDQLLTAQRLWISFRDAHCASEGYGARGGSMEPMLISGCRAILTRERTAQLRGLADLSGG
jgi:uncharacterized protein YecT (DUF1311 family)